MLEDIPWKELHQWLNILIIALLAILTITLQFLFYSGNKNYSLIKNFIEFEDNNEFFEYHLQLNKLITQILIMADLILSMTIEFLVTKL